MAVIPKFWYKPGRIPSILEGFIPGWKESFQDGRNPSAVGLHILAGDVLDGAGDQVVQAVLGLLQLDLLGVGGGGGVNRLEGSGLVGQGLK